VKSRSIPNDMHEWVDANKNQVVHQNPKAKHSSDLKLFNNTEPLEQKDKSIN